MTAVRVINEAQQIRLGISYIIVRTGEKVVVDGGNPHVTVERDGHLVVSGFAAPTVTVRPGGHVLYIGQAAGMCIIKGGYIETRDHSAPNVVATTCEQKVYVTAQDASAPCILRTQRSQVVLRPIGEARPQLLG